MSFIIWLLVVLFILSIIKEIISNHKEEILGFLGIIGGIIAIVVCTIKFGFWNVVKFILIIVVGFFAILFISSFISVLVEEYYDRKAIKTEKKVRNYVFGQPRNISYSRLKDRTNEFFGSIRLGKKHNVKDYIDKALEDFTARNATEIYRVIGQDIREKISVDYNEYYTEINQRLGSYCLGNCSFKDWVDHCLSEFAIKTDLGGMIYYIEKNAANDKDNKDDFFSKAKYKRNIIDEDDDDDDLSFAADGIEDPVLSGINSPDIKGASVCMMGLLAEDEKLQSINDDNNVKPTQYKRVIIDDEGDDEDDKNGFIEVR